MQKKKKETINFEKTLDIILQKAYNNDMFYFSLAK